MKKLADDLMPIGEKYLVWNGINENGTACPSGIYLAKIKLGNQLIARKLMLMK